jgi:heat shock protein HtpX
MWEQIRANKRRSIALIALMAACLMFAGYGIGGYIFGPGGAVIGIGIALILWGIEMAVYMTTAESMLLDTAMAKELKRDDSPRLFNIVDEMRLASGLEYMPKIYLIDAAAPNACAIGHSPETSAIAVTTGLMYRLDRDELQGVIAHEISHLKNRDTQFLTLAAVMLGSVVILSEVARRMLWFGGRGRSRDHSRGGGGQGQAIIAIVALVFAILSPILVQILYFACSRKREFLADACAAQFTRYPQGLASALEKISKSPAELSCASKVTAPMFIVSPMYADGEAPDSVFSSHPSTAERIRVLRSMAGGSSLADYQAAYQRARGGSLIGNQSLQSAPSQPIRPPSNEGPIAQAHEVRQIVCRASGYIGVTCDCGLEMNIPERFPSNEVRCIRCGKLLTLPTVQQRDAQQTAVGQHEAEQMSGVPPLLYTRQTTGWESVRCACGSTIQISPGLAAPYIHCKNCGRLIEVKSRQPQT